MYSLVWDKIIYRYITIGVVADKPSNHGIMFHHGINSFYKLSICFHLSLECSCSDSQVKIQFFTTIWVFTANL